MKGKSSSRSYELLPKFKALDRNLEQTEPTGEESSKTFKSLSHGLPTTHLIEQALVYALNAGSFKIEGEHRQSARLKKEIIERYYYRGARERQIMMDENLPKYIDDHLINIRNRFINKDMSFVLHSNNPVKFEMDERKVIVHARDEKIETNYADSPSIRLLCQESDSCCDIVVKGSAGSIFTVCFSYKEISTRQPMAPILKVVNTEQLIEALRKKFFDGLNEEGKRLRKAYIIKKHNQIKRDIHRRISFLNNKAKKGLHATEPCNELVPSSEQNAALENLKSEVINKLFQGCKGKTCAAFESFKICSEFVAEDEEADFIIDLHAYVLIESFKTFALMFSERRRKSTEESVIDLVNAASES